MKALSIDPEYASYIYNVEKTVECRTWKTNHRGPLLICASKIPVPGFVSGHAICVADLVDIVPFTEEHLEAAMMDEVPEKAYAWIFGDVKTIIPFPVRGKMGLFDVDDSLIEYFGEGHDNMSDAAYDLAAAKFDLAYMFPLTYIPGEHNEAYNAAIEYGKKLKANPALIFAPDPIPDSITDAMKD